MTGPSWRDLAGVEPPTWEEWDRGGRAWYPTAYGHGFDAGYAACDERLAELQRRAVANVRAAAELPERDRAADEARAEKRRAWWARRRGEG